MERQLTNQANLPVVSADSGLSGYLAEIRKFPILEKEQEYMLAKRWVEHEDSDAARDLVTSHLRLAAKVAMGYRGYGLPIADVISEANVGLMQAVKKFDPERGFRLATYAIWWIRASVQEFILRSWSLVRMGTTRSQKKLFFNLRKAKNQIGAYDSNLSDKQAKAIAESLDVSVDDVQSMNQRLSAGDGSLNLQLRQDNGDSPEWQDVLVDESADHVAEFERDDEAAKRSKVLERALLILNERETDIFLNRRMSEEPLTLEALAKKYEVSRERIRQIEERSYEKVKAKVIELAREGGLLS